MLNASWTEAEGWRFKERSDDELAPLAVRGAPASFDGDSLEIFTGNVAIRIFHNLGSDRRHAEAAGGGTAPGRPADQLSLDIADELVGLNVDLEDGALPDPPSGALSGELECQRDFIAETTPTDLAP